MPSFAGLGKFFGRTASEGAAFAAGIATAPTLAPVVRELENETWKRYQSRPVAHGDAAEIVAENVEQLEWGKDQASQNGLSGDKFEAIVGAVMNAPGFAQLLTLYRRGEITQAELEHGFRKARLETRWDSHLETLRDDRLDPAVVALAIVRGLIEDPGILPVAPPVGEGKVPKFPTFNVDAVAEAAAHGIDRERLSVLVGNTGRPMAVVEAARAAFRGIIERVDFDRAIAEGDIRNEWKDALYDVAREILTANQYAELQLRGYLNETQRRAGTALHGMSAHDSDLLYDVLGRSIPVKQVTTGEARGGVYGGDPGNIPEAFLRSLQRGNLRPEYYPLAYANRYTLPSAFVIRSLLKDGAITADQGNTLLLESGWEPKWARLVADHYATATAAPADPHAKSATTGLLTTIRHRYTSGDITEAQAADALAKTGLPAATRTGLLSTWTQERDVKALAPPPAAP